MPLRPAPLTFRGLRCRRLSPLCWGSSWSSGWVSPARRPSTTRRTTRAIPSPSPATEPPMLRRILLVAVLAGAVAGLVASVLQGTRIWPLIAAAEQFEEAAAAHQHGDAAAGHAHDWQPADGAERIAYTVLFNILAGFGFALLLNGALVLRQAVLRGTTPDVATGAMWGLAGFACFALAPAFGLPPELPGMEAANLLDRQLWWVATAAASAAGLALIVFARSVPRKAVG